MGTRNLTCVVQDGEFKVSQYCQWDGYPSGQGEDVLKFVQVANFDRFRDQVRALKHLTEEEIWQRWIWCGANPDSELVNMDVSKKFEAEYPHLHRNAGADVLRMINKGETDEVQLTVEFGGNGLFCEFAYLLDLDNDILEFYTGDAKVEADSPRFWEYQDMDENSGYGPIALSAKYPFADVRNGSVTVETLEAVTA